MTSDGFADQVTALIAELETDQCPLDATWMKRQLDDYFTATPAHQAAFRREVEKIREARAVRSR